MSLRMAMPGEWQFSLVLFIGLAAAMVLPPVRRAVPRWFESLIWLGLITAGWLTITSVQGANARLLTDAVTWGVGQIAGDLIGLVGTNTKGWLAGHRFEIANAVVLLALLDVFVLALLWSRRQAQRALPRVMLGEWFEFQPPKAARARESGRYLGDESNLRVGPTVAVIVVACVIWFGQLIMWPRRSGLVWLESVRGRPASDTVRGDKLIDIRALVSAPAGSLTEDAPADESSRLAS